MATATEIASRALKRLGVVDALHSPSAADSAYAIEALNAMIEAWEAEGLSGDTLPLHSRFEAGIIAMLAERLAEDYGISPGPILLRDAERGRQQIEAAFFVVPESRFESSLLYAGANITYSTTTSDPISYDAWLPSTAYTLRMMAINGNNVYECTTAGTSASSGGPTGTDDDITDGTAHWCWRRVA